ncbi:MAG: DUF4410 domain-containing protein [Planctomycetota bacterium]
MSSNPYQSPATAQTNATISSVQVQTFAVNTGAFKCTCFTPETVAEALQQEIVRRCEQQGLCVSGSDADCEITGKFVALDEGSQTLRYLLPFIAGASHVHAEGEIRTGDETIPFRHVIRSRAGAFGGRNKTLIQNALERIGVFVAAELGDRARQAEGESNVSTGGTFLVVSVGVALVVALILAGWYYQWAWEIAAKRRTIKPGEVPYSTAIIAVLSFISTWCFVTAVAPVGVLRSRAMSWLVGISGTKTLGGLRFLLFVLTTVMAGLAILWCSVAG